MSAKARCVQHAAPPAPPPAPSKFCPPPGPSAARRSLPLGWRPRCPSAPQPAAPSPRPPPPSSSFVPETALISRKRRDALREEAKKARTVEKDAAVVRRKGQLKRAEDYLNGAFRADRACCPLRALRPCFALRLPGAAALGD